MSTPTEVLERSPAPESSVPTWQHRAQIDPGANQLLVDERFNQNDPAVDRLLGDVTLEGDSTTDGATGGADDVQPQHSEWTVIVDLTANKAATDEPGSVANGAAVKQQELLALAAQTEGTGIQMVVQTVMPLEPGAARDAVRTLTRYLIRDGEVIQLHEGPSQGTNQDMQDLLSDATKVAPASHNALILQSHGLGSNGIAGDAHQPALSQVNVQQVRDNIEAAFAGSEHGAWMCSVLTHATWGRSPCSIAWKALSTTLLHPVKSRRHAELQETARTSRK